MIPEIGQFALVLALCVAATQGILPLAGAARGDAAWMAVARPAALAQFGFVAIAFGCLTYSFIANDFSVLYVASHSNSKLPLAYRIAGVWGGHEGSLLLWVLMLTLWTVAVAAFSRRLPDEFVARVLGVMGLVSIGFLTFMLFTSNPFDRLLPAAPDGRDLNPLLQDPGMVVHPPMLYMGYVGFSVSFAFAISALLYGRLDATWARWSRPWTTAAWTFLTLGIMLGSAWAYYELGWGGWWFWDPVENASFMPWLVGTALIHSLAVTEKRGAFKAWTVLLAIIAFSLSLLGTFLVRSGVLTSVHAFATDPKRGIFILGFLTLVIGGSLVLFAWRAPRVGIGGAFTLISREAALLTNNVLLVVAAGAVLLGTLYPLALDALGLGKISVGPPYFETVFVPLMAPVLFLIGIGPIMRWKNMEVPELVVLLRWAFVVSVVTAIALPLVFGRWSALLALGFLLALWVVASCAVSLWRRVRQANGGGGMWGRLRSASRSYYGMLLAHFGIAVFVVGVTLVKGYESESEVRMVPGDTVALAGYVFRLDGVREVKGPNYVAARATMNVSRDGRQVGVLNPEKRLYTVQQQPMTEAAIDTGFTRDLYVSLGDSLPGGAWLVRVQHKPFITWVWGGCLLMAFGGALAASDRRYRVGRSLPEARPAGAAGKRQAASAA
ncbi:MAG: c-type cytochrome biogenesis protein CcmF [Betaproteobacteria bacterium RIFCSPLOWO2_12_FULL_62_13]|nr:MAG: c-type cytochrome biogenesis protein CcmF [Betaproteobacteria bacterium RIFCSPLOWO2_12_FULL_62_13]